MIMLSVTALASYMYCSRKLYLERVLKIVEIPKDIMVKGSIKHSVYDRINKTEQMLVVSLKDSDIDSINSVYRKHYSALLRNAIIKNKRSLKMARLSPESVFSEIWPMFNSESLIRSGVIHDSITESGFRGEQLWENLVPKIKSEYRVSSENLGVRGIIDQLHVYPDRFLPFELKSGKAPTEGVWPGHKVQVGAYILLLEDIFKTHIKRGFVRYLDSGESRQVVMNPFFKDELLNLIKKVNELLNSDKIPDYCKNENKCKSCSLKDTCYGNDLLSQNQKI